MIQIDYPEYHPRIKKQTGTEFIFDEVRRKWIQLTPEEWVRQHFLQYLIQVQRISASLIAVEKTIQLGELKKRFDIVVYKQSQPYILIECKEPGVLLSPSVLEQALRYQIILQVPFIIVTNGPETAAFGTANGTLTPLDDFPV